MLIPTIIDIFSNVYISWEKDKLNIFSWNNRRKLKKELKDFNKHLKHLLHVNDDILADSTKDKLNELRDMIKVNAELSSTAKACLFSSGITWAIRLAGD